MAWRRSAMGTLQSGAGDRTVTDRCLCRNMYAQTGYNNSGFMHATDWIQTIAHAAGALPELQRLTRFPLDGMDMYDGTSSS